jgi:hypothetical protein
MREVAEITLPDKNKSNDASEHHKRHEYSTLRSL